MGFDFGSIIQNLLALGQLGGMGFGFWNMFNKPSQQQQQPQMGMPAGYSPPQMSIEMPDMSEWFAGLQEMLQPQQDRTPMLKNLASSAAQARKGLQAQGVYSGGAITPDALASLMQLENPADLTEAWKLYGDQYGLGPLPV